MGDAKRIVGGLLSGAGGGILEKARADRAETLRRMTIEGQQGLIRTVVTGEDREMYGITGAGDTKKLGIKDAKSVMAGRSAGDQRLWDDAIERYTEGVGSLEGESIIWPDVAKALHAEGRPDLARMAEGFAGGRSSIKPDSPEYLKAEEEAEAWGSDQAGWFSSDKKDFAKFGGNRTAAVQAKTEELYRKYTGQGAAAPAAKPAAAKTLDSQYKTEAEVGEAYQSGALTFEQAQNILREQFGQD